MVTMAGIEGESRRPERRNSKKTVTMDYFIETRNVDEETADMLRKYDIEGTGSFSKDSVVNIIHDLQATSQNNEILKSYNKLLKKILLISMCLGVLLLAGMFSLSYAVAALTANTSVSSNGAMQTTNHATYIATDSIANSYSLYQGEGEYCMTPEEAEEIQQQALSGRNVLVSFMDHGEDGSTLVEQLSGNGATIDEETGTVCFLHADGVSTMCMVESGCGFDSSGRRLQGTEAPTEGATEPPVNPCPQCVSFKI